MRPYQDRELISDFDFNQRTLVVGPLGRACPPGHHPATMILYFLLNAQDKERLLAAARGQSLETLPLFSHCRQGNLGTLDAFWQSPLARNTLAAAIQFIPTQNVIVITHMVVKPHWRRLGVNSRLVESIQHRFPQQKIVFYELTDDGKRFVTGS